MAGTTESSSAPHPAESPGASPPAAGQAPVNPARAHESLWGKLARHLGRKRHAQTGEDDDSDSHDDMRRAGDREPDKDAAFEEMLVNTYRGGQGL